MKAIALKAAGAPDQLEYIDMAKPEIKPGEVLVQVKAISINPVDVKTRMGKGVFGRIKEESPLILGWDISGIVTESASEAFKAGDEVFGMINFPGHGKAYAEYVAAPADQLALKPQGISHEEAAAATLVALTAWQALVTHAKVRPGQKVLIHAAAGGVGHIAVQLAKHLGAQVTGTSSARNRDFVLGLGADEHIDYHHIDWSAHPVAYDFVLDTIGGDNIDLSLEVTRKGGKIISIPSGLNEEVTAKAKAKGVDGYFILVQSNGADMREIAALLGEGTLKAHVSETFSFEQMPEAHRQLETGRTVGKIAIKL
ncbi:NADP-dependent oxidoreductase [Pedobacter sp. JY14-1]|uniref:NADP-dependent oxidoreductase n=1 Tax=Pedobacter sp. JY14-1 TaxID=3034151 RepID=UPI0023E12927|nr:NADP-dependent oxidoreductase [Pedobacter sp. JY14-1]